MLTRRSPYLDGKNAAPHGKEVNEMTLPSFSAETSLYETNERYRAVGAGMTPTSEVQPAFGYCEYVCNLCFSTGSIWACHECAVSNCPEPRDQI